MAAIIATCPISTPMLKPNKDKDKCSPLNPSSPKTLAKPKPWNKPKTKAIIQSFPLNIGFILWYAAKPMDSAIIDSTNLEGKTIICNDARLSVMVCAIVKKVMIFIIYKNAGLNFSTGYQFQMLDLEEAFTSNPIFFLLTTAGNIKAKIKSM